uniref:Apple domain-containing protein n=1 Tax=Romanomermis culicivorax TaxID=13658 RepID=A0A915JGZ9_ROMCU
MLVQNNCNYTKNDVENELALNISQCIKFCHLHKSCTHYVWVVKQKRCYLKASKSKGSMLASYEMVEDN